jgi:hypothetical protein
MRNMGKIFEYVICGIFFVVGITLAVKGFRANQVEFTLNDRSNMKYEVLIGRNALETFGLPVIVTKNPDADTTRDESQIEVEEE